jgi:ADP-ribose pyrophosphatase YjhB (NUDIX family)
MERCFSVGGTVESGWRRSSAIAREFMEEFGVELRTTPIYWM